MVGQLSRREVKNMMNTQEILADITHYSKYAKYIDSKYRREVYAETVERNKDFHLSRYPFMSETLDRVYDMVESKRLLPSMRTMQFAGKALSINNARAYNCSFQHMSEPKCFADLLFLLLSGCGVGYSVQRRHVDQLPSINKPTGTYTHIVGDTIEGWSDAGLAICDAYFSGSRLPVFDFSEIRPEGSPLVTSGGRAPGPAKLKEALIKVGDVFERALSAGLDRLRPIDVHDINCHFADCVAAGGIRRSAMISLFDHDDKEMLNCKSGQWWEDNGQRARANNSVVLLRGSTTHATFKRMWDACRDSFSGEPGFFWTNDLDMGMNPCGEIALRHRQFCNLITINFSKVTNQSDFEEVCEAAAIIGTLQATLTDFKYIHPEWKATTESEALIGVSLTGIADNMSVYDKIDLRAGANVILDTNAYWANKFGIKPSARCTTGKPDGTSSLILETSSGVHARHNLYYLRTMRFGINEPISSYLQMMLPSELVEIDVTSEDRIVVGIPVQSPASAVDRSESAMSLLTRTARQNTEWIAAGHRSGPNTNNQSVTISLRDDEWDDVMTWMWDNRSMYTGISVLPYDGGTYKQAPFQDLSAEEYARLTANMKYRIDMRSVFEDGDNTSHTESVACAGGACEISF